MTEFWELCPVIGSQDRIGILVKKKNSHLLKITSIICSTFCVASDIAVIIIYGKPNLVKGEMRVKSTVEFL